MTIQNKTMLITYSDSLGKNLKELNENLGKYFWRSCRRGSSFAIFSRQQVTVVLRQSIMMRLMLHLGIGMT